MINTLLILGGNFLRGKLTYTVAWLAIIFAVFGLSQGYLDQTQALVIINANLGLVGIRRAINTP